MRQLWILGLLGVWPSAASAATLTWEPGAGAASCAGATKIQLEIERRLAKPLASVRPKRRVRVEIERRGDAWVAHLEMRDAQGAIVGQRTLSVIAADCGKIEQYTAIVLTLILEGIPEAGEAETAEQTPESAPSPAPAEAPRPPPPPEPVSTLPAPDLLPRVSGTGDLCVFVEGAVYGPGSTAVPVASAAVRADGQRLQSALAAELEQRDLFTVIRTAPSTDDELSLRSRVRRGGQLPAPIVTLPTDSGKASLAQADYVLVPLIEALTVQDGLDYSLGSDPRAIVVNARVALLGFDLLLRRELPPVKVSASLAFAGNARDTEAARLALQTALQSIASDALTQLSEYSVFSEEERATLTPRAGRACAVNRGRDERPSQSAHSTPWDAGFYLDAVKRFAYAQPTESQLVRARATGLRTQELGSATELGVGVRLLRRAPLDSGWRPGIVMRAASVTAENPPLIMELQGSVGYEVPLQPGTHVSLLPHVSAGILFSAGTLGADGDERARLGGLFGATVSLGLTVPFYRAIGDFSPFVGLDAQCVLPLMSETPESAFLDSKLPRLHGVGVELGFLMSEPRSAKP